MLLHSPPHPNHKPIYARSGWEIPQANSDDVPKTDIEINRIRAKERQSWRGGLIIRSISTQPYNCGHDFCGAACLD